MHTRRPLPGRSSPSNARGAGGSVLPLCCVRRLDPDCRGDLHPRRRPVLRRHRRLRLSPPTSACSRAASPARCATLSRWPSRPRKRQEEHRPCHDAPLKARASGLAIGTSPAGSPGGPDDAPRAYAPRALLELPPAAARRDPRIRPAASPSSAMSGVGVSPSARPTTCSAAASGNHIAMRERRLPAAQGPISS